MAITKKVRFEVFKRDSFTCHYCGRKAPDVILQADHIEPKSKGGTDDLLNLITSCFDCNAGKSDRTLSDDSVVVKQRAQLEVLQERKEQIEMMMDWQRGLAHLDDTELDEVASFWSTLLGEHYGLNETGRKHMRKLLRQFGLGPVATAMRRAVESYVKYDADGKPTVETVEIAYNKVGGICRITEAEKEKPYLKDLFYIRGIMRNTYNYVNLWEAKDLLETAYLTGAETSDLKRLVFDCRSWTAWREAMWAYIDQLNVDAAERNGLE